MNDPLDRVALMAAERLRSRQQRGEIPVMLGLHGLLALQHDKIRRFNETSDHDEILDMAGDALAILLVSCEKEGVLRAWNLEENEQRRRIEAEFDEEEAARRQAQALDIEDEDEDFEIVNNDE